MDHLLHTSQAIFVGPPGFFARPKWESLFRWSLPLCDDFLRTSQLILFFFVFEFIALFFCSFSHIYNENAMLFSALYVVFSFFQRLSCNIGYFVVFHHKSKKSTGFISFFDILRRRTRCSASSSS